MIPAHRQLSRCHGLLLCCLLASPVAWAKVAAAQSPEQPVETCPAPSSEDTDAARLAFRDGQASFSEGAYLRAVELWKRAYQLDCSAHALLLNLAMAQELLGRPEDAVRTLELFNRRVPDSPYRQANHKRIELLRRQWVEQSRARAREQHKRPQPAASPPTSHRTSESQVVALALAAGGGLMALAAGAIYVEGRASASSAEEGCGQARSRCASPDDVIGGERARARSELAGWLAGGGLLVAATGSVWYLLSTPTPAGSVEWGASVSENGSALRVRGRF